MVRPDRRVPLPGEAAPPWPRDRHRRVGSDSAGSGNSLPGMASPARAEQPEHSKLSLSTWGCPWDERMGSSALPEGQRLVRVTVNTEGFEASEVFN